MLTFEHRMPTVLSISPRHSFDEAGSGLHRIIVTGEPSSPRLHISVMLLSIRKAPCQYVRMTVMRTVHRLFLLAAMLAIVIGPMSIGLAGSAMASSGATTMEAMATSMSDTQMTEDMPCCPQEQPVKPDCAKGCPLALVCTTSITAYAPEGHGWSFAISWRSHRYDLMPVSQLASALIEPPSRPPKA